MHLQKEQLKESFRAGSAILGAEGSTDGTSIAGLAIGDLPGGPMILFYLFCSNGMNNERWWIGEMLADL